MKVPAGVRTARRGCLRFCPSQNAYTFSDSVCPTRRTLTLLRFGHSNRKNRRRQQFWGEARNRRNRTLTYRQRLDSSHHRPHPRRQARATHRPRKRDGRRKAAGVLTFLELRKARVHYPTFPVPPAPSGSYRYARRRKHSKDQRTGENGVI